MFRLFLCGSQEVGNVIPPLRLVTKFDATKQVSSSFRILMDYLVSVALENNIMHGNVADSTTVYTSIQANDIFQRLCVALPESIRQTPGRRKLRNLDTISWSTMSMAIRDVVREKKQHVEEE